MRIPFLAIILGLLGLTLPAHAGLIGATVDLKTFSPDLLTLGTDMGSQAVSASVEYPSITNYAENANITDTQIIVTNLESVPDTFGSAAFNGFEFLFSGVTITGATANGSSAFNPFAITVSGNNVFLNYQGVATTAGGASIIDVTTSAAAVPEPGTFAFVGAGMLSLGIRALRGRA